MREIIQIYETPAFQISLFKYFYLCVRVSCSERTVAVSGASFTLLASCKVLLNLSAIRHFDDP